MVVGGGGVTEAMISMIISSPGFHTGFVVWGRGGHDTSML